jgi:hypothetical protein
VDGVILMHMALLRFSPLAEWRSTPLTKREKGEAALPLESGHTGEVDVEVSGVFARVCLAFKGGAGRRRSLGAERDFAAL